MRVTGPGASTTLPSTSGTRRPEAGGTQFSLPSADPAPRSSPPPGTAGMSGLDALIALQAIDADQPRGRRRAVKRGHDLLDTLEELKVGLLSGTLSGAALDRLATLVAGIESSGEPAVDAILAEISLRAEVELAKLGRYREAG